MDRPIKQHVLKKNRLILMGITLIIVIAAAFLLSMQIDKNSMEVNSDKIQIGRIQTGKFQETIPLDGIIEPIKSIYLDAIENGRIEEIYVNEGDVLAKGQSILRLSNKEIQLEVIQREELLASEIERFTSFKHQSKKNIHNLLEQQADLIYQLKNQARKWKQDSTLFLSNAIAKSVYEESLLNYQYQQQKLQLIRTRIHSESLADSIEIRQMQSSLNVKKSNLALVKENQQQLELKAPESGLLTMFSAQIGEFRNRGESLGRLDIESGFKVKASIDEHYLTQVKAGQIASFDLSGKKYSLEVKSIFPQVVEGKFQAELIFSNEIPTSIKKGQSIQLQLALSDPRNALIAERGAWNNYANTNKLFIINEDKKSAELRIVMLGRMNTNSVEILEGAQEGDLFIKSSYDQFKNITHLEIIEP
jgi:HlyD family secretion protein